MQTLIMFSIALASTFAQASQSEWPDLSKKEDLIGLGVGRIVEKDRSIIKNITLHEVKEYWIVYIKNGSSHDLMIEGVDQIEFYESEWGRIKLQFPEGKPIITKLL